MQDMLPPRVVTRLKRIASNRKLLDAAFSSSMASIATIAGASFSAAAAAPAMALDTPRLSASQLIMTAAAATGAQHVRGASLGSVPDMEASVAETTRAALATLSATTGAHNSPW
jgi:hypothetical protein